MPHDNPFCLAIASSVKCCILRARSETAVLTERLKVAPGTYAYTSCDRASSKEVKNLPRYSARHAGQKRVFQTYLIRKRPIALLLVSESTNPGFIGSGNVALLLLCDCDDGSSRLSSSMLRFARPAMLKPCAGVAAMGTGIVCSMGNWSSSLRDGKRRRTSLLWHIENQLQCVSRCDVIEWSLY